MTQSNGSSSGKQSKKIVVWSWNVMGRVLKKKRIKIGLIEKEWKKKKFKGPTSYGTVQRAPKLQQFPPREDLTCKCN